MTVPPTLSPTGRDSALERAAAILGAFDEAHRELTLAALVRRSGLPRSTTHRTAMKMVGLGWLDKPGEHYRIGTRLFEISGLAPIRLQLREAVLPVLQELYAATRATVQLGVLQDSEVLIVEKIAGHRPLAMLSQVGGKIPAHCSALGRAILAHGDPAAIDVVIGAGLTPRTPRTITNGVSLRRELAAIPHRGWAIDREEGNVGINCVAAPIFGPLGEVVAAVSVTGPVATVRPDRLGPAVRMAASAASRAYSQRH